MASPGPTGRVKFGHKSDLSPDNMSGGTADDAGARSGLPFYPRSGEQGHQSAKPEESRSVQDNSRSFYNSNSATDRRDSNRDGFDDRSAGNGFGRSNDNRSSMTYRSDDRSSHNTSGPRAGTYMDNTRDPDARPAFRSDRPPYESRPVAPRSDVPRPPPVDEHQKKSDDAKKICLEKAKNIGRELFKSRDMADVMIVASDGVEISAHKMILSVRSPEMKKYFEEVETPPEEQCRVSVNGDFSGDIVQIFIELLYTGEAAGFDGPSAERDAQQLIFLLASHYGVTDLLDLAALKLTQNVNLDNFVDLLIMSYKESSEMMKGKVMEFAIKNRKAVLSSEGFKVDIKQNHLDLYLNVLEQLADA